MFSIYKLYNKYLLKTKVKVNTPVARSNKEWVYSSFERRVLTSLGLSSVM